MDRKDENRAYKNNLNNGLCTRLKQRENNRQHISSNENNEDKEEENKDGGEISPW